MDRFNPREMMIMMEEAKIMEPSRGETRKQFNKGPLRRELVNMKLLAFLLIMAEIFILFNSVSVAVMVVYGFPAEDRINHWPPPPLPPPSAYNQNNNNNSSNRLQDNIREEEEFPRYIDNDQRQMIRIGGIEIATYAKTTPPPPIEQQKPNVSHIAHVPSASKGHHRASLVPSTSLSLWPDQDSHESLRGSKRRMGLDRYHHSSGSNIQLAATAEANVNARPAASGAGVELVAASGEEERKSNPLIELEQHTRRRTKRAHDDNEATLASIAMEASDPLLLPPPPPLPLNDPEDNMDEDGEDIEDNSQVFWGQPRDTSTDHFSNDGYEMDKQVNELPQLLSGSSRVNHQSATGRGNEHWPPRARNYPHHKYPVGWPKNIRPHSYSSRGGAGSENYHERSDVGRSSSSRKNKNGLCHRDCGHVRGGGSGEDNSSSLNGLQEMANDDSYEICGSDGRLYGSMCDLRLQSCRQNVHLLRRPKVFCLKRQQQDSHNLTVTKTLDPNRQNGSEQVRIVELKRRCNLVAFNEMKSLLISEFNGDVSSMFNYFDANGDNYIEAHELWPRQGDRSNKLRYAQLWDEHSSKCASKHSVSSHHRRRRRRRRHHDHSNGDEDPTKCWFFLDFVFEPQFSTNPCSLSHLMLFDLRHPNQRFDLETFARAFEEPKALWVAATKEKNRNKIGVATTNLSSAGDDDGVGKPLIRTTRVQLMLGESISLGCLLNITNSKVLESNLVDSGGLDDGIRCLWTRYNLNLGALQDPHLQLERRSRLSKAKTSGSSDDSEKNFTDLTLELKDAQLYLSGHYKCECYSKKIEQTFEHLYSVQVSAEPRVNVRPKFQWSLPGSRISFECHYDYIDTRDDSDSDKKSSSSNKQSDSVGNGGNEQLNDGVPPGQLDEERQGQFGLRVEWLRGGNGELLVDSNGFNGLNQSSQWTTVERQLSGYGSSSNNNGTTVAIVSRGGEHVDDDDDSFYSPPPSTEYGETSPDNDNDDDGSNNNREQEVQPKAPLSYSIRRASITMAASRLTLENLTLSDSGRHTCRVGVAVANNFRQTNNYNSKRELDIFGSNDGTLLVQEQPKTDQAGATDAEIYRTYLWMFHDNGISIYRLQNDDGQEMELLREINGHSLVSGEVEGNWNQLTLCGGLNPEQVVICEWSDNALHIDVKHGLLNSKTETRKYIYVGQPNLNRIIVIDGLKFEIVAIINTEPQPRKLYLYKPSKIHLSKWVRRRLSPAANARWLAAIGTHAHSPKLSPLESKLYSSQRATTTTIMNKNLPRHQRHIGTISLGGNERPSSSTTRPSPLVQHDIWLLCYGQPLVVDPSGDEHLEEANSSGSSSSRFYSPFGGEQFSGSNTTTSSNDHKLGQRASLNSVQPFTPRLTAGAPPFGWPSVWPSKESKLRNRKSVHIIQSTFFPRSTLTDDSLHNHDNDYEELDRNDGADGGGSGNLRTSRARNETVVGEFKRSTVLTTHHVFSGIPTSLSGGHKPQQLYLARPQFDLIQDLYVPPKPYSLELNDRHKTHHAYVTHYNDRRLFRVSMDEYRYDREIDLQNCDPINLVTTAQGLLVVQCRSPITHNLIGQMVLDQLTSSRIEFNANIKAQESYLSPDHRYLVSIFNNSTLLSSATSPSVTNANNNIMSSIQASSSHIINDAQSSSTRNRPTASTTKTDGNKRQSIIYVQMISVSGLRLQYEIKTALEISQCSFVWKDGYYAALFVSTNRRDDQSEILSLRLADSRLQLMARVPGLISVARHKDQLIVSPELRLAALSTNQGSYVVDLEDNRVSQSLRHHQSPPTLLWV